MTPMQAVVLAEIQRAGHAGCPLARLQRLLDDYREIRRLDPPKDAALVVRVTVQQIKRHGYCISDGRCDDRRYRMQGERQP